MHRRRPHPEAITEFLPNLKQGKHSKNGKFPSSVNPFIVALPFKGEHF